MAGVVRVARAKRAAKVASLKSRSLNPLNTKLSPKNTVFNRLVRFFLVAMTLNKPQLC